MKLVSIKEISALGKWAIGMILTFGGLLQVPQFEQIVFKLANLHPHIATIVGALTTLAALLANPQVQKILGIQETRQVETATGTVTTQTTTEVVAKP